MDIFSTVTAVSPLYCGFCICGVQPTLAQKLVVSADLELGDLRAN